MKKPPLALFGSLVRQRGMSIIEMMVGMTLGILVTLIITQVWGMFENQKQRTVSSSSAQAAGLLALTELEQDVRSAGAGLTDQATFNCTTTYSYYETGGVKTSPAPAFSGAGGGMVPVQITDGGTGSDTLTVKRSADFLGAIPATLTSNMPQSSAELNLSSTAGFADGDIVVAVSATGACTVMLITQVQDAALKLQHNPGDSTTYNPTIADQTAMGWPAYVAGDKILKVGQLFSRVYTVNASNQLTLTDYSDPAKTPAQAVAAALALASDIVKIKAQYGVSAIGVAGGPVIQWVNATATNPVNPITGAVEDWSILDSAKIKRIKAIRLVVVARSAKMEGSDVIGVCTNTSGGVNNGPCAWADSALAPAPLIDLSANANWKRYRYRVYQTIIPVRNVIWAGV